MTTRLSIINLAGIARTLVAVGTSSDASMFLTTAAAAPRSTWLSSPGAAGTTGAFASAFSGAFGVVGAAGAGAGAGTVGAGGAAAAGVWPLPPAASVVGSGL